MPLLKAQVYWDKITQVPISGKSIRRSSDSGQASKKYSSTAISLGPVQPIIS